MKTTIREIRRTYSIEPGCAPDGGCEGECEPGYRDFPDQQPNPGCAAHARAELWREAAHHAAAIDALPDPDDVSVYGNGLVYYTPAHVIVDLHTADRIVHDAIADATRWTGSGSHWKRVRAAVLRGLRLEARRFAMGGSLAVPLPRTEDGSLDRDALDEQDAIADHLIDEGERLAGHLISIAERNGRTTLERATALRSLVHLGPIA